jgi:hypothetical protein
MSNDKLAAALQKLDPENDNHWTADGQPRLETLRMLSGDTSLTREAVVTAAPTFNRDAAKSAASGEPAATTPAPVVTPVASVVETATATVTPDAAQQSGEADAEARKLKLRELAERMAKCTATIRELNDELVDTQAEYDALAGDGDGSLGAHLRNQAKLMQYLKVQAESPERSELDRAFGARRR